MLNQVEIVKELEALKYAIIYKNPDRYDLVSWINEIIEAIRS